MDAPKLKPGQKVLDWGAEYDHYIALKRTQGLTQAQYAEQLGVDKSWVSTNFAQIRRERYKLDVSNLLPRIMAESLRDVQAALNLNRDGLDDRQKQGFALEAFAKVADRAGFSPQAVMVNVQQNNSSTVVMPPIFGGEYSDGVKQMLGSADDGQD
jgi:hypothetical protein